MMSLAQISEARAASTAVGLGTPLLRHLYSYSKESREVMRLMK